MAALACGLGSLEAARVGAPALAFRLILIAALADAIDGALARRLNATGPIGMELDSLSDVITFGAAPAFLFSTNFADAPALFRYGTALVFAAAGAFRLARFHTLPPSNGFTGLPITAAGVLLAATAAWPFPAAAQGVGLIAVLLAFLMVSTIHFAKPGVGRKVMLPAFLALVLPVALIPGEGTLAVVTTIALGAYIVWNIVGHFTGEEAADVQHEDVQLP